MPNLNKSVNDILAQMRANSKNKDWKAKGTSGEEAVFVICEFIYQLMGGILYHSYEYKVDKTLPGNIKSHANGELYIENLGSTTEIDILMVTPYKIFPLELKAYKAKEIVLTDERISGCMKVDKSPVHQHEMHMRHLYSELYKSIPNGETKYIEPIVVLVDQCSVIDNRSDWQKDYIKVTNLNNLENLIKKLNKPEEYRLDLYAIAQTLKNMCVSYSKYLPLRVVD